jgi:cell wall-associated NlpC family hydrolase
MATRGLQTGALARVDTMNTEALNQFIGKPWKFWAFGPDAFDCWGLTVTAARVLYGVVLPDIPVNLARWPGTPAVAAAQLATGLWRELPAPRPGAVLALLDMRGRVRHASLCVGVDRVLHTTEGYTSRIEALRNVVAIAPAWKVYTWQP